MPAPKPTPLGESDWNRLRDQFAVAVAQAIFTANPNFPIPSQRAALVRSIWDMADALIRARTPDQTGD